MDFSPHGTRHFILTCVTKERSIQIYHSLTEFKYDLIELGINLEYFHASEDNKAVRDRVFKIINPHLKNLRIDSAIVDKQTAKSFSRQSLRFYSRILGELIRRILHDFDLSKFAEVIVITDQIPLAHRRQAVEKSIKQTLKEMLPSGISYRIFHHESKSNLDLQIADYCNWAVFRKWERDDLHYFRMIQSAIKSESKINLEEKW